MRETFEPPQPNEAGHRIEIVVRPVHRARLLLHHPETATSRTAIEIVVEGL